MTYFKMRYILRIYILCLFSCIVDIYVLKREYLERIRRPFQRMACKFFIYLSKSEYCEFAPVCNLSVAS